MLLLLFELCIFLPLIFLLAIFSLNYEIDGEFFFVLLVGFLGLFGILILWRKLDDYLQRIVLKPYSTLNIKEDNTLVITFYGKDSKKINLADFSSINSHVATGFKIYLHSKNREVDLSQILAGKIDTFNQTTQLNFFRSMYEKTVKVPTDELLAHMFSLELIRNGMKTKISIDPELKKYVTIYSHYPKNNSPLGE